MFGWCRPVNFFVNFDVFHQCFLWSQANRDFIACWAALHLVVCGHNQRNCCFSKIGFLGQFCQKIHTFGLRSIFWGSESTFFLDFMSTGCVTLNDISKIENILDLPVCGAGMVFAERKL